MQAFISTLSNIYQEMIDRDPYFQKTISHTHKKYKRSALNLCRYLLLRSHDLRDIHSELTDLGISSLRTPETYVYRNLADALKILHLMEGEQWEYNTEVKHLGYKKSQKLLKKHSNSLFGKPRKLKSHHIMVTMPTEAAEDYKLVKNLILSGMKIARINLSHDDQSIWKAIIDNLKKAQLETGKSCKVYMDLSGPKIRTGKVPIKKVRSTKKKKKKKPIDFILINQGDELQLHKKSIRGKEAKYDSEGKLLKPAQISITIPSIIDELSVGDRVFFDDGKIASEVKTKDKGFVTLLVTRAASKGVKLKSEKGINFPDTKLNLPSLTDEDIDNLPFVANYADIIGYSFVRTADDVAFLQDQLKSLGAEKKGLVLKIENHEAFYNMPAMLLQAMSGSKIGVMIARGDLAVEVGFERISEVQEEILWLCEAAHVPVIWATQVLENLAKKGNPSRAEITDAAMSARAECVMLNKGPYILDATKTLQTILRKMERHQSKKKNRLRKLRVASFITETPSTQQESPISNNKLDLSTVEESV